MSFRGLRAYGLGFNLGFRGFRGLGFKGLGLKVLDLGF